MKAPVPDNKYYHDNTTAGLSITKDKLPTIATLKVGILASIANNSSALEQAKQLKQRFTDDGLTATIVAERLTSDVDKTYSAADATDFDAVVVASSADAAGVFSIASSSPFYPPMRPLQIATNAYLFGKPVAYFGGSSPSQTLKAGGISSADASAGVFIGANLDEMVKDIEDGLKTFKFTSRFPMDS